MAPFLALVLVFQLYVLGSGVWMSLTDATGFSDGEFVGLDNFRNLLWADPAHSGKFWRAVGTSLRYTAGCLVTLIPLAFLLATALNRLRLRWARGYLRGAFLVPVVINSVTAASLFFMYFKPSGLIDNLLGAIGLPGQRAWLMDSDLSVPIMVLVTLWRAIGLQTIVFLAQLQTVDPALYEAAQLDGASRTRMLWHITLPLLRPAMTFAVVTTTIQSLQMFDLSYVLFPVRYGPGGSARTIVAHIYEMAFSSSFLVGQATAAGWITFVAILLISLLQFRVLGLGRQER
ncbi:MAG TPA: sugar ABC transporter permease [Anaeromyxobacter sp.]|nr:sugar ABC transporter permease [Anaeromyxobacter sp.]